MADLPAAGCTRSAITAATRLTTMTVAAADIAIIGHIATRVAGATGDAADGAADSGTFIVRLWSSTNVTCVPHATQRTGSSVGGWRAMVFPHVGQRSR